MSPSFSDKLTAKVRAVNCVHTWVNILSEQFAKNFKHLEEEVVTKVDGTLKEKYKKLIPQLPENCPVEIYFEKSNYTLGWTVKRCEHIDNSESCLCYKQKIYVADIDHTKELTNFYGPVKYKADYKASELCADIAHYHDLHEKAEEAKAKLFNFQEFI